MTHYSEFGRLSLHYWNPAIKKLGQFKIYPVKIPRIVASRKSTWSLKFENIKLAKCHQNSFRTNGAYHIYKKFEYLLDTLVLILKIYIIKSNKIVHLT